MIDDLRNTVINGECLEVLKTLPADSIDCCVTSPPYWGLRDYGTATWEGGDPECDHSKKSSDKIESSTLKGSTVTQNHSKEGWKGGFCGKCGAKRIDQQLGLEKTPEEFIAKMVEVFAEVKRVLKPEGSLWLNLGDCYKNKQLCGMPWRVALALQADGWYLREDIIWHKPNPMPESIKDRCTKAHEYIFHLTRNPTYYHDQEAIKEDCFESNAERPRMGQGSNTQYSQKRGEHKNLMRDNPHTCHKKRRPSKKRGEFNGKTNALKGREAFRAVKEKRNKRSVWTVPVYAYAEAHFATYPPDLIRPCILAGCPEFVCSKCGKARTRIIKKSGGTTGRSWVDHSEDMTKGMSQYDENNHKGGLGAEDAKKGNPYKVEMLGWTDCGCGAEFKPGIVIDPFGGAFTTALVSYRLRRDYLVIELNPEYINIGKKRLKKEKDKYGLFE